MKLIDALMNWFNARPWLNLMFFFLALLGILLSVILFLRGKREKLACYNKASYRLITDRLSKMPEVEVLYLKQPVRNLTLSKFAIWNRGRDPIDQSDFAPAEPLRIDDESDGVLLGVEVSHATTSANHFQCRISDDKKRVMVTFDYFGRNEGVVIDVYHTGSSERLRVHGMVKGYRQIEHREPSPNPCTEAFSRWIISPLSDLAKRAPRLIRVPLFLIVLTPFLPLIMVLLAIDAIVGWLRPVPSPFKLNVPTG